MPYLMVKLEDKIIDEMNIVDKSNFTIGRHEDNDLVIEHPHISHIHAAIEREDNLFFLTDLKSTKGTCVNERLVLSRKLNHGDVITIGPCSIDFYHEEESAGITQKKKLSQKTLALDTKQYRSQIAKGLKKTMGPSEQKKAIGVLTNLYETDMKLTITKPVIKIGKDRNSDIQVKGFFIAKTICVIEKNKDDYYLKYIGGLRKPRVNETIIKNYIKLSHHDVIHIAGMMFQFHIVMQ